MDTFKGVLIILVLLLGGATFLLFIQSSAAKAQLKDATLANAMTLELLRAQGASCTGAGADDFKRTAGCIEPLLAQKDFKEDGFSQPKNGAPGYLVIKNINRKTYAAQNFTFYFNREATQEGCHLPGDLGYNTACRFEFSETCKDGYVLEVNYTSGNKTSKVFTKNC